jgi:transposase
MNTSGRAIVAREKKRRRRTVEEKRRVVEESLEAGASVTRIARRHGLHANQLFQWRKLYREGRLDERANGSFRLLPVTVTDGFAARSVSQPSGPASSGTIYAELPKGHLRICGQVDAASLRAVLECLLG